MFNIRKLLGAKNVNVAAIVSEKQIEIIKVLQIQLSERRIFELRQAKIIQDLRDQKENIRLCFHSLVRQGDVVDDDLRISRLEVIELQDQQLKDKRTITALNAIILNLRKQKVYPGQKFYNPEDHRAPTVYLCARWNEWYIVRQSNQLTPSLITAEQWKETYGHLVVMPQMNSNLKNLS